MIYIRGIRLYEGIHVIRFLKFLFVTMGFITITHTVVRSVVSQIKFPIFFAFKNPFFLNKYFHHSFALLYILQTHQRSGRMMEITVW